MRRVRRGSPHRAAALLTAWLFSATLAAQVPPSSEYGALFTAVQTERVFADSKAFADAVPKRDPAAILADYDARRPTGTALRTFVLANFIVRGENDRLDLRTHVRALWPQLVRQPVPAAGSALALDAPYVVPGGRFQEIYYWDSYFTMLGLRADGETALVEAMIDNFVGLIERHGHIPNGTRSYYLSRSQPPYFALMLDLSTNRDADVGARRLAALKAEYRYWMAGASCLGSGDACLRVVRMPDGSLLNRYYDDRDTPRDEAFAEDVATAAAVPARPAGTVYRDLRAAAESGWDFSTRWLRDPGSLASIRTTDIVPVDLNSLLWAAEVHIAEACGKSGDHVCTADFERRAAARKAAIDCYLWDDSRGYYGDWDRISKQPTGVLSAAALQPLFVGLASTAQADAVAEATRRHLLAPGGIRATGNRSGQQWDAPNGWAPLQWIAANGLARSGHRDLAHDIACRWLGTVGAAYAETGKMLEKYDVERRAPGGGGEYPVQDGFGWTNGVVSALLAGHVGADPVSTPKPLACPA